MNRSESNLLAPAFAANKRALVQPPNEEVLIERLSIEEPKSDCANADPTHSTLTLTIVIAVAEPLVPVTVTI